MNKEEFTPEEIGFRRGFIHGFSTAQRTNLTMQEVVDWGKGEEATYPPGSNISSDKPLSWQLRSTEIKISDDFIATKIPTDDGDFWFVIRGVDGFFEEKEFQILASDKELDIALQKAIKNLFEYTSRLEKISMEISGMITGESCFSRKLEMKYENKKFDYLSYDKEEDRFYPVSCRFVVVNE